MSIDDAVGEIKNYFSEYMKKRRKKLRKRRQEERQRDMQLEEEYNKEIGYLKERNKRVYVQKEGDSEPEGKRWEPFSTETIVKDNGDTECVVYWKREPYDGPIYYGCGEMG